MHPGGRPDIVVAAQTGNDLTVLLNTLTIVGVAGREPAMNALTLRGHPNPARRRYSLSFDLPRSSPARVSVLDAMGRRVKTLHEGSLAAGAHRIIWDLADSQRRRVAAGLYFCELRVADDLRRTRFAVLR
jgi:hypothetical protein